MPSAVPGDPPLLGVAYSPQCVEWAFSEVRKERCNKYCNWVIRPPLSREYAALSRAKRTPREGAGQLPALLLDQGQLPHLLYQPLREMTHPEQAVEGGTI
jgi:hypothetical protein